MPSKTLTVIIPALNEEGNIRAVCEEVAKLAEQWLTDYEILVFDDASRDQTAAVVEGIRKKNSNLMLFRNDHTRGLGYNYQAGVLKARYEYVLMVPGDNEVNVESLEPMFRQIGAADLLLGCISNPGVRPLMRQFVSQLFIRTLNVLFGNKISYYNGPSVIRTEVVRQFLPLTDSFTYMAALVVQSLKAGYSYQEFPFALQERRYGKSKALNLRNAVRVIRDMAALFWRVNFHPAPVRQKVGVE